MKYDRILLLVMTLAMLGSFTAAGASAQVVTIQGKTFYKDGRSWLPKGVNVTAFVRPKFIPSAPKWMNETGQKGREWWGPSEFAAIKKVLGGEVIRFQISQAALDSRSSIYDREYLTELLGAIKQARAAGFVVICSMNTGGNSGLPDMPGMPDDGTTRAWQSLAPALVRDTGIMLELYNEPQMDWNSKGSHQLWAQETQALIETVRSLGSTNILLLDGLGYAQSTNDLFPLVHDRMPNRMAMAVHPYLHSMRSETHLDPMAYWRKHFSISAAQVPMIATEWNATEVVGCVDAARTPDLALALMRHLASLRVGVIGWAVDSEASKLFKDHTAYVPTDYSTFTGCSKTPGDSGGGKLLANYPNN